MNIVLWILQGLLAAMFLTAGTLKLTQTHARLEDIMPWVKDFSTPVVRFVGVCELLAAVGLILPAALDIAPWLTPLAASGLALLMTLAAIFHVRKRELSELTLNVVVVALALIVAICRFGPNAF